MVDEAKGTGVATLLIKRVTLEIDGTPQVQSNPAEQQLSAETLVVEQGQILTFVVEFSLACSMHELEYSIQIHELGGRLAFASTSMDLSYRLKALQAGTHVVRCLLAASLPEGEYTASFGFVELTDCADRTLYLAFLQEACNFQVQLPLSHQSKGYAVLPSSLLYQQKSSDILLPTPPDYKIPVNFSVNKK